MIEKALISALVCVVIIAAWRMVPQSILVGTNCDGTRIAVAWEEDQLPRCQSIERHRLGGH